MKKLLIFVVVVAVIGAGVWYYKSRQGAYAPAGVSPTPSAMVSVSPTPSPTPSRTPLGTPVSSRTPSSTSSPQATPTTASSTPTPGVIFQQTVIHDVNIQGFAFSPSPLTVKKGDVVVFKNFDTPTHTVTALNKMFDSKNIRSGDQWTLETANLSPGSYEYQCTLHPSMRGTIVVQ